MRVSEGTNEAVRLLLQYSSRGREKGGTTAGKETIQNKNLTTLKWEMMDMTFFAKLGNARTHLQRKRSALQLSDKLDR